MKNLVKWHIPYRATISNYLIIVLVNQSFSNVGLCSLSSSYMIVNEISLGSGLLMSVSDYFFDIYYTKRIIDYWRKWSAHHSVVKVIVSCRPNKQHVWTNHHHHHTLPVAWRCFLCLVALITVTLSSAVSLCSPMIDNSIHLCVVTLSVPPPPPPPPHTQRAIIPMGNCMRNISHHWFSLKAFDPYWGCGSVKAKAGLHQQLKLPFLL